MTRRVLSFALCLTVAAPGCALFGGKSTKRQEVDKWAADSKSAIAEGAAEEDAKLVERLRHHRDSSEKIIAQHAEQAMTSNDVILGVTGFNGLEPSPFDQQVAFLRKHGLMLTPVPSDQWRRGKFFEPTSKENMAKMQAKAKDTKFMAQARVTLPTLDALGAYLLKEAEGTTAVSWTSELIAMMYAAEIVAFENKFETKASDELLGELSAMMAIRDQARLQMATHTALLAAFSGVANGGDPKAVMELAAASKKQINDRPVVSAETARAFADELGKQSLDIAASLESMMRAAQGDEVYERHFQSELVRTLKEIEKAEDEASLYDMIDDAQKQAHMTLMREKAASVQQRLTERAKSLGLQKAEQLISKLPFGNQIISGITALRELRNGNPRAALVAAIEAVPSGPIKEGMKTATNIGFAAEKMIKDRKRRG